MENITVSLLSDEKVWQSLLTEAANASYRQTLTWESLKRSKNIYTYIFTKEGSNVAGVRYSISMSKFGLFSTADIRSGIVFKKDPDEILIKFILNHFIHFAKKKHVSYIRITPWIPRTIRHENQNIAALFEQICFEFGFHILRELLPTYWITLDQQADVILSKMKRQTRYEIKHGEREGLVVKPYQTVDNQLLETFWNFYSNIGTVKDFNILSEEDFKQQISTLITKQIATMFVTYYKEYIVNISLASNIGQAAYLFGAINREFKNIEGCPSPGETAQWAMIKYMKDKELKIYDMGFCSGEIPDPNNPFYQIWRFKYGFGGDYVEFLPQYGKVIKPISGRIFEYLKK